MTLSDWRRRLTLHQQVRQFFLDRGLLEVDVPMLSTACGTDPHLDYFETAGTDCKRYLPTSPEFFLKRLLSQGFPSCFCLTHAFRKGETGRRHNCEFSIAEWYEIGWDMDALMQEVEALVNLTLKLHNFKVIRWEDAFRLHTGADPWTGDPGEWSRSEWWDLQFATRVEPHLGRGCGEFVVDYPASAAALAQTYAQGGKEWARRFELYVEGVELCNGYQELTDAKEQARRFEADLAERQTMGKPCPPVDTQVLAALQKGMPPCSGVALGLDRLYMLAMGKKTVAEVLLFADGEA
jgi:lysyl-tRNA synthetase class 2